jgi:hypothetical protein
VSARWDSATCVPAFGKQIVQLLGGVFIACVGPVGQCDLVPAFGKQIDQLLGGVFIACVSPVGQCDLAPAFGKQVVRREAAWWSPASARSRRPLRSPCLANSSACWREA